jgi:cysteine desulfurase / selenocysteine lyase
MINKNIKNDFPILKRKINGEDLVYLDNAATSQKPQQVIAAITDFYTNHNANVHRGIHTLSEEATDLYEGARKKVAQFIGASFPEEIVFTKGTTESLNRVAFEWAIENLKKGDVILTTEMEHHSNLVPWQIVADRLGVELKILPFDSTGDISLRVFEEAIDERVKLVAVTHASNVFGTILPVKKICKLAKEFDCKVVVDGAQAIPHMHVNVASLGCDFYAFSGHKMLGPTGIGVLWVKRDLLENMPPYEYGGGMIDDVSANVSTWAEIPEKFEAGTPNVAGAVGLAAAIDYLEGVGMDEIKQHDISLNEYALSALSQVVGLEILGPKDPKKRTGLVTFNVTGIHSHDISAVLNSEGVAVRSGHHCAQLLHKRCNIHSSTRASFYFYNTKEDVDKLIIGLEKAKRILG